MNSNFFNNLLYNQKKEEQILLDMQQVIIDEAKKIALKKYPEIERYKEFYLEQLEEKISYHASKIVSEISKITQKEKTDDFYQ